MYLELHDSEEGNTLLARIPGLDYDYQAEQHVQETAHMSRAANAVKWILLDEHGVRCVWERTDLTAIPDITQRSSRFTGTWEVGPNEAPIEELAAQ